MTILIPTCPKYITISQTTLKLLDHYWPNHPEVRIVLDGNGDGWVATITRALQSHDDPLFILLLDDYGACAPAKAEQIVAGADLLLRDEWACIYPLCWYPAQGRLRYRDSTETVELHGAPILLQAAIWRRSWFLELAGQMDPRTSPWGFERIATQLVKQSPRGLLAADIPDPAWLGGEIVDGHDKSDWPLPYHNLMHHGQPALQYEPFLHSHDLRFPSRGLGDTIARVTHATGIDRLMPAGCGCAERREKLNALAPYRER